MTYLLFSVPGSLSWRIPLGIQLLPGIILALGCSFLPPSPRLLVLQGRPDEALASLAKLRLRSPEDAESDPLLQVTRRLIDNTRCLDLIFFFFQIELLEMKVEATLTQRTNPDSGKLGFVEELKSWKQLFSPRHKDRTMIGVMIMFFQRKRVYSIYT